MLNVFKKRKVYPKEVNTELTSLEPNDSLKIMTKDEFIIYSTTGKWKGNSKKHALESFNKASKGHEFIFYSDSKNHTYSVDYIDAMLRRE